MSWKIVFVDDEQMILRAIRRVLFRSSYECSYFESGQEALDHMAENGMPDMVITDMMMPEMDGLTFLNKVRELYPSAFRGMLSGYSDNKRVTNAIIENLLQFYIHKPWQNDELLQDIERLLSIKERMTDQHLNDRMDELGGLPTLPKLHQEISAMIRDDASVDEITEQINRDFVISANILRIANRAHYGCNASSIKQAIMMIGLLNVQQIIIATDVFKANADKLEKLKLWEHAFLTNRIVKYLFSLKDSLKMSAELGSAGLLHTIGLILLMSKLGNQYDAVLTEKKKNPARDIAEIEQEILGYDHMEAGGFLLNWWGMPIPYIESALNYRLLSGCSCMKPKFVYIVYAASHIAWKALGIDLFIHALDDNVLAEIGMDKLAVDQMVREFR